MKKEIRLGLCGALFTSALWGFLTSPGAVQQLFFFFMAWVWFTGSWWSLEDLMLDMREQDEE